MPINAGVQGALQQMVNLMASSGAFPAPYSVAPLYSAAQSARYDAVQGGSAEWLTSSAWPHGGPVPRRS